MSYNANQFRPAGHESGLRTTCWFYTEITVVPHNNYLQNISHMQRGETGAKTFLLSSKMILQYMLRKVHLRREHALGARKALGNLKILKIQFYK